MMGFAQILTLFVLSALLRSQVLASEECVSVTTTIPYLGWTTRWTALPDCHGTVTVIEQTPLNTQCPTTSSYSPTWTQSTTTPTLSTTTTQHTTTSSTSIVSSTPSPITGACLNVNPLCAAEGFDIDYYFNMLGGYSNPYNQIYSNYYLVDGLKPLASSLTNITYFPENALGTGVGTFPNSSIELVSPFVYTQFPSYAGYTRETNGGLVVDANNFTLVYSGYFRPSSTGAWNICASADNENDIYFGHDNAYDCLSGVPSNADNPLVKCSGGNFNNAPECAEVNLVEGLFYPIRSIMANWQGPSSVNITMVPPGTNLNDGSHDFTGVAYPRSCGIFL